MREQLQEQGQELEQTSEICFLRYETSYGPFFSSKGKAASYMSDQDYTEEQIEEALNNTSDYVNIVPVTLDDEDTSFDG